MSENTIEFDNMTENEIQEKLNEVNERIFKLNERLNEISEEK